MCGINGIIKKNSEIDRKDLVLATKLMKHRGPDADNIWISEDGKVGFSQTRLSITDLSSRADQPLIVDDGDFVIVFNGEIYNYMALRDELKKKHNFKTTSDTEVIVACYKAYGVKALSRIEGMFAFAIYDKKKNLVFIARDVVGQKPFLYAEARDAFLFASEIPVLLAIKPELKKEVDDAAIRLFLTSNFSHIPAPFTAFANVRKLLPGHYMIVKNGKVISYKRYYKLKKIKKTTHDEKQFLFDIIDEMKPRDVIYASLLSGGNDSSFVSLALRDKNDEPVEVYTLSLGKGDLDFERSRYVCKTLHLKQHVVNFNPSFFLNSIESQVRTLGEPYYHTTSVYADQLFKEVKKRHKVVFSGAGGDEVYYGYDNARLISAGIILKLNSLIPGFIFKRTLPKEYAFLKESSLSTFKKDYYENSYSNLKGLFLNENEKIHEYFSYLNDYIFDAAEINTFLDLSYMSGLFFENSHSLTVQGDLVGMMNSIEVRCPFLEKRVIENGFSLPLWMKVSPFRAREGKEVLKKVLCKDFSRKFVYGKKIGFGTEIKVRRIIGMNTNQIKSKVLSLNKRKIFSKEHLLNLVSTEKTMEHNFHLVMKLYSLACWFEQNS